MEKVNNSPLLSIIVPVYNVEKYLEKCVQSIIHQEYNNIELILVDDGSKDNSGDICDELAKKDKRIVVIHKQNGGQGSARNRALDIAKGDYITFVDSDDEIAVNTYKNNIQILEEIEDVDILQYPIVEHFGTSYAVERRIDVPQKICDTEEIFYSWLSPSDRRITGYVCNKIFRKEIFNKLRFRQDIIWEDRYIECVFFTLCKGVYVSDIGNYFYYDREGSTVRRKRDEYYYKSVCVADSRVIESIEGMNSLKEVRKSRSILLFYYCVELAKLGKLSQYIWNKDVRQILIPRLSVLDILRSSLSIKRKMGCLQGKMLGLKTIERLYGK